MTPILDHIVRWRGSTSPDDVYDFCDLLCRTYEEADAVVRAEIREAVAENENVKASLLYDTIGEVGQGDFLIVAAARAKETREYVRYLRLALFAVSITDGFADSRDTLMWLAKLWTFIEENGVDPTPHYQEIGAMSSTEAVHEIGGPTAGMILQMLDERRRNELTWR